MAKKASPKGLRKKVTRDLIARLSEYEHGLRGKLTMVIFSAAVFYVLYLFCAGDYGLFRISRLIQQRNTLNLEYKTIVAEAAEYKYDLRRMHSDPHFVEFIARTRFGFSKPKEIIYRMPPSKR